MNPLLNFHILVEKNIAEPSVGFQIWAESNRLSISLFVLFSQLSNFWWGDYSPISPLSNDGSVSSHNHNHLVVRMAVKTDEMLQ